MAISNLITSAHCIAYINTVPLARTCGLTCNIDSPRKAVHCVDTLEPVELITTSLSASGTLQIYRLHLDGAAEAAGMIATWTSALREKYCSLMVLDRLTDSVIIEVDNFCVTGQQWSFQPKAYLIGTLSWTGFGYSNDASDAQ